MQKITYRKSHELVNKKGGLMKNYNQVSERDIKHRIRAAETTIRNYDPRFQRFSIYREALVDLKLYKQTLQIGG